jgi:uncharacterized damage-inducible protein DinB
MEAFFTEYLNRLESLHNDLRISLAGLSQAAVDWSPGEGMNSLGVLAVHVSGSERYWIGDVVAGEPSGRNREAEFRSVGLDSNLLEGRLVASLVYVRNVLEGLRLEDLGRMCFVPHEGREHSVGNVLAHVLAHIGVHAGHAQVTRQLWDQTKRE